LSVEVDAGNGSGGEEVDLELSVLADGDSDRAAGDRVFAQAAVGRDPADLARAEFAEPEGAVGAAVMRPTLPVPRSANQTEPSGPVVIQPTLAFGLGTG
jgi:hypothetical protein